MEKVAEFDIELISPHMGGYNGSPYDVDSQYIEPPRPTEFKALWRWWYRVLINDGSKDYESLDEEVGKVLGSQNVASNYIIRVIPESLPSPYDRKVVDDVISFFKEILPNMLRSEITLRKILRKVAENTEAETLLNKCLANCSNDVKKVIEKIKSAYKTRYFLYIQPRSKQGESDIIYKITKNRELILDESVELQNYIKRIINDTFFVNETFTLKLIVYSRKDGGEVEKDLIPLIFGFIFGGVGSGNDRGLGSIIIRNIYSNYISENLKKNVIELFRCQNPECANMKLEEIIREAGTHGYLIPPNGTPTSYTKVASAKSLGYKILSCNSQNRFLCLEKIWSSVQKANWKKVIWGSFNQDCQKCHGGNLHTDILGLPRRGSSRDNRRGRGTITTGYNVIDGNNKEDRRKSYISFKVINDNIVLLTYFYSSDFYDKLNWVSSEEGEKSVYELKIAKPSDILNCRGPSDILDCRATTSNNPPYDKSTYIQNAIESAIEFIEKCFIDS
ncbi:type III-B CRISPR module RAMP protein Cmr1 [Sulfolobus sp. E5-1-F]|uniref:type III-B CRISPR module RAMP protein Cmr1 n=1 Tax=Saccharolobus sp. E5-1-F TaxID=2663019 RepID=UPI0012970287|nr:type III-B CRISPR module RAMP protein Cmr1 [Sulfolobus sp. E5-1-F]QGA53820.1 type III-B CRISPR module RAMP protein Cmr1 [Sulfolobus sp. E5-1-F]